MILKELKNRVEEKTQNLRTLVTKGLDPSRMGKAVSVVAKSGVGRVGRDKLKGNTIMNNKNNKISDNICAARPKGVMGERTQEKEEEEEKKRTISFDVNAIPQPSCGEV